MKLQVDPLFQSHFLDGLDVARPGSERQPVERVQDLLIFRKLFLELRVIGVRLGFLGVRAGKRHRAQQHTAAKPGTSAFSNPPLLLLNSIPREKFADNRNPLNKL